MTAPDRRDRALDVLRRSGADVLLAADAGTVAWLTSHTPSVDVASPFAVGPLALLGHNGVVILVASEDEQCDVDVEVELFAGYSLGEFDRVAPAARALRKHGEGRLLALESGSVPAGLIEPASGWIDVSADLLAARMVKDADEIVRIRAAVAVCDSGQAAVRSALRRDATELDLWAAARAAIDASAGAPTPLLADMVSGERTSGVGGPPTSRRVLAGEVVICDLAPRHGGVWGDSCVTIAMGEPSDWAVGAHRGATDALYAAIAIVRPGVTAGAIDTLVRQRLGVALPHHVGHGIGAWPHEQPRIVPGAATRLEEGMVLAIEPGIYGSREGVRVEQVVLVTATGCEVLSAHDLSL